MTGAQRCRAVSCYQRPAFGGLGVRACRPAKIPGAGGRAAARHLAGVSPLALLLRLLFGLPSLLRGFLCAFLASWANRPALRADRAAPGSRIRAHPRYAGTAAQPCTSLSLAPSGRFPPRQLGRLRPACRVIAATARSHPPSSSALSAGWWRHASFRSFPFWPPITFVGLAGSGARDLPASGQGRAWVPVRPLAAGRLRRRFARPFARSLPTVGLRPRLRPGDRSSCHVALHRAETLPAPFGPAACGDFARRPDRSATRQRRST